MKRIKMMLMATVAALAIGAVGASAASADGVIYGNISGVAAGNSVGPCSWAMNYTGTPSSPIAVDGDSFNLNPPYPDSTSTPTKPDPLYTPCDPSTISITDFSVAFSGSYIATLGAFSVTAEVDTIFGPIECTFPVAAGLQLTGGSLMGEYSGGGESEGSNCLGITADLDVTDVVLEEV